MSFGLLPSSLFSNATTPTSQNAVRGRLVDLRPDPSRQATIGQGGGLYAAWCLIEVQAPHTPAIHVEASVPLTNLESALVQKFGALGRESIVLLRAGSPLSDNVRHQLASIYRIMVRVPLLTPTLQIHDGSQFQAFGLELLESESKGPSLSQVVTGGQALGEGQATPWPTLGRTPPITPIPIPWSPPKESDGSFRLGYARINVPARHWSYTRQTKVDTMPSLREQGTMKRGTGMAYESYTLSYMVSSLDDIQSGVVDVINQIQLTPFLTVEGGPFGNPKDQDGEIPYGAIAVRGFSLSTVEGLPGTLEVSLSFDPFQWDWYIPYVQGTHPVLTMDDAMCWPLFKLWTETNHNSILPQGKFNGRFDLSFPDPSLNDLILNLSSRTDLDEGVFEDVSTLQSAARGVLTNTVSNASISSPNVKEILLPARDPNTPRVLVLRIKDQSVWNNLVSESTDGSTSQIVGNPQFKGAVLGLVDWTRKLEGFNYADSEGNFLGQSMQVPISYIDQAFGQDVPMTTSTVYDLALISLLDVRSGISSWRNQIRASYTSQLNGLSADSVEFQTLTREMEARLTSPWAYYGIAFKVDGKTRVQLQKSFETLATKHQPRANPQQLSPEQELRTKYMWDQEAPRVVATTNDVYGDLLIEHISGTRSHNLSLTSTLGHPLPLHQYMGGSDVVMVVEGKCFSQLAVRSLQEVKEEFDRRAQLKISRKFVVEGKESTKMREQSAGFLRVENEIFQLLGVDFVVPLNLSIEPVDEQPGVWSFTMTFIEYNPGQLLQEQVRFLPTSLNTMGKVKKFGWNNDANPLLLNAQEWFNLQYDLSQLEVYPDLQLPTTTQFQYWVSTCQELASLYLKAADKNRFLATGVWGKGRSAKLSSSQQIILDTVREFFTDPQSVQLMSKWTNFRTQAGEIHQTRGKFVDPDFYIHYDLYGTWSATLDAISRNMMGSEKDLKASGRGENTDHTSTQETGPVTHDSLLGVKHVHGPKFWATHDKEIPGLYQKAFEQAYSADPNFPDHADQVKKQAAEYNKQFDMDTADSRWWATGVDQVSLEVAGQPGLYALSPEQTQGLYNGVLDDTSLNLEETLEDGLTSGEREQQGLDKSFLDTIKAAYFEDGSNTESILSQYNSLGWRQQQAIMAAKMGANQATPIAMKTETHGFWFYPGAPFSSSMKDLTRSQRLEILQKLMRGAISSSLAGNGDSEGVNNADPGNSFTQVGDGLFDISAFVKEISATIHKTYGYLSNTARLNSNYQSLTAFTESPVLNLSQGNAQKNTEELFNYVDQSAKYVSSGGQYVDPHILRSFFMVRDGMGAFNPQLSLDDGGFGDISKDVFSVTDGVAVRIKTVASKYARYMQQVGNVPTLALALLDMELTTKTRQQFFVDGQLQPGVLEDFQRAANIIRSKRFSSDTGTILSQLFESKYSQIGQRVDRYWAQYIKLNRVYGSYLPEDVTSLLQFSDPYFYALNGIVQMDAQDNEDKYLTSRFSPSGQPVTIALARNTITSTTGEIDRLNQPFNLNKSDLDLEIQLERKLGAALDPHSEAAIYGSMVDVRQYGCFGRLAGAFPAYQVIIVNEGFYWGSGNRKLWDQYYSRTGVAEIEVFKSRLQPGGQCNITFSNMFNNLTAYTQLEVLQHELSVENNKRMAGILNNWGINTFQAFWETLTREVPADVVKIWQSNHVRQLALSPGARLHVRMGFGANASSLPIVFNGTVTQMPVQEGYVTLMAVGDGYELEKPTTTSLTAVGDGFSFNDGGPIGFGKDPSSIISEAMIGAGITDNILQGAFRDHSKGVTHFGEVYFKGLLHYPTETQINIYSSNQTKLEQQIPMIANYLNVNALYNWSGVNLFSVQINEPTLWKVLTVCRRACLDYVGSAEEFCTRGTVFFGKPWWPYNYTYAPSFLDFARKGVDNFGGVGDHTKYSVPEQPLIVTNPGSLSGKQMAEAMKNDPLFPAKAYQDNLTGGPAVEVGSAQGLDTSTLQETEIRTIPRLVMDAVERLLVQNGGARKVLESTSFYYFVFNQGDLVAKVAKNTGAQQITPEQIETTLNAPAQDTDISDFLLDVKVYVQHLRWKNYMQAYFAHSMINLLQNDIVADRSKVYTDAIGTHVYNGVLSPDSLCKTIAYSIDSDIQGGDRRTMMVNTGIIVSTTQGGLGRAAAEGITKLASFVPIPVLREIASSANQYISETPTTPAVQNAVISALIDSVKEMYQGNIVMCGMPSMKPRDLLLVSDHKNDMRGPVFVKEVVHRLDSQNGLITIVTPDCVAFPHSSQAGYHLVQSLAQGALARSAQFYTLKTMSALTLGQTLRWKERARLTDLDGSLSRYSTLLKNKQLTLLPEEEMQVLEAYKARVNENIQARLLELDEKIKKLSSTAGDTNTELIEKLRAEQAELRATNSKIQNFSNLSQARLQGDVEGYGLDSADYKSFNSTRDTLRARATQLELDLQADEALNRKALDLMDLHGATPEQVLERYKNERRAKWALNPENEAEILLIQAEGETGTSTLASDFNKAAKAMVETSDELDAVENELKILQEALATELKTTTDATEMLRITESKAERINQLRTRSNRLRAVLVGRKRALTRAQEAYKLSTKQADRVLRTMLRGGFLDDILGSTIDYARAVRKLVSGFGRGILGAADDARAVAADGRGVTKVRAAIMRRWDQLKNLHRDLKDIKEAKLLNKVETTVDKLKPLATKTLDMSKTFLRAGTLASYAGPQVILRMAADVTLSAIGGSMIEGINARWKARQVAKILPLMVGSPATPYTAGIRGHQGACVSDDPSWADNLIMGFTHLNTQLDDRVDSPAGYAAYMGTNALMFTAAMLGLEAPEYAQDPADAQYMNTNEQFNADQKK